MPPVPDESREYFRLAQAAELVGDDVTARWGALLKISRAASRNGSRDRARAYRLAQVTESLAPYLSDALDHEAALHAIARLDPREGIAVASRWRDRRLGWLDPAIEALAVRDDCTLAPEPLACIAMTLLQQRPDVLRAAGRAVRSRPADAQSSRTPSPRCRDPDQRAVRPRGAPHCGSGIRHHLDGTPLGAEAPATPATRSEGRDWRALTNPVTRQGSSAGTAGRAGPATAEAVAAARTLP